MNAPVRAARHLRPVRAALHIAVSMLLMPLWHQAVVAADGTLAPAVLPLRGNDIGAGAVLSAQARQLAGWVAATGDHTGAPFIIVDKMRASVFVFDADARLRAHSAVLLGSALGDDSVPGIGIRPMAQILAGERTTPAGRFVAERGRNMQGEDIVWVDYDAAISMHRVRTGNTLERRAERLATSTVDDNRISYGCINVPVTFYESYIQPVFALRSAVVYVLPDTKPLEEVFGIPRLAITGFDAGGTVAAPVQRGDALLGDSSRSRRR